MKDHTKRLIAPWTIALGVVMVMIAAGAPPVAAQVKTVADQLSFPKMKDIPMPVVERQALPNGMKVLLVEDHDFPILGFQVMARGGMLAEPAAGCKPGVAELTGELLRSGGTQAMTGDAIDELLDRSGAYVSAGAGADAIRIGGQTLAEHADRVLPLLADMLRKPVFEQGKLDLARRRMSSSIARRNDQPMAIVQREFTKLLYGKGSPYARQLEYADLQAITREDLVRYHGSVLRPDQTIVALFGDFKTAEMKTKLAQLFGDWKVQGAAPVLKPAAVPPAKGSVNYIEKKDIDQTFLFLGHPGFRYDDPDYPAVQVMADLLGGGFASRIFKKVRTEMGLAYSAGGNIVATYDHPGFFYFFTSTKPSSTLLAIQTILDEVKRIREAPVTSEELNYAKSAYLNAYAFDFDSKEKVVRRLLTYEFYGYPADFNTRLRNAVEKVTVEDIARVAKKHLQPSLLSIVAVGIKEQFDKPLDTLGTVNTIDITIPEPPKPAAPGK